MILQGVMLNALLFFLYHALENKSDKLMQFEGRRTNVYNSNCWACKERRLFMCKEKMGDQLHLTYDDRFLIQRKLNEGCTFKEIGRCLSKDPTTISREVKKHRQQKTATSLSSSRCIHISTCKKNNVCNLSPSCYIKCSTCSNCSSFCSDYAIKECKKINKPPYVCNGCEKKIGCRIKKTMYRATDAYKEYKHVLSTSRAGIDIDAETLTVVDELITPLIKNGQSINHIYSTHQWDIPFSSRTLYNYISKSLFEVLSLDLPRKVRYKPRKKFKPVQKDSDSLVGRKYIDFQTYIAENPDVQIIEMDTVKGRIGGKLILTLYFRTSKLMLGFLLEHESQVEVVEVLDQLESALTTEIFKEIFPVLLTDNGSGFSNPYIIEMGSDATQRTKLFYCDPYASQQKGGIEKNHEFIRYILPKGTSFDHLDQGMVTLLMNHINSTARESLNNSTPHKEAALLMQSRVQDVLGLKSIPPDMICLKPKLLKL